MRIVAGDSSRPDCRDSTREPDRLSLDDVALDERLQQMLGARIQHAVYFTAQAAVPLAEPASARTRRVPPPTWA